MTRQATIARWLLAASTATALTVWGCGGGGGGTTVSVASITVADGQSIGVDQIRYLSATARDSEGRTVSLAADAFEWRVATGGAYIRFQGDGRAVGVAEGVPTVVASVGAVSSAPTPVTVTPAGGLGCSSTSYTPNYVDAILTLGTPNVSGNVRFWARTPLRIGIPKNAGWTQQREDIFKAGVAQWQTATSNGISIVYSEATTGVDIFVQWVDPSTLPSNAIGVTYATYNAATFQMSSARIDIANDLPTNLVNLTTASHEYGHALGIGGHSPVDSDLMYYAENGITTTTVRDLNTVRTIYCDTFPAVRSRSVDGPMVTERILCERPKTRSNSLLSAVRGR